MHIKQIIRPLIFAIFLTNIATVSANISGTDLKLTKQALENIKQEKYGNAKILINDIKNKAARQVTLHALYRSRGYVTHYSEIENFIVNYPDWKNLTSIKSIIEKRIFRGQYDDRFAKQWFNKFPAKTGAGKLYLAEQMFGNGHQKQGLKLLRSVLRRSTLDSKIEKSALFKMGQYLANWDYKLRSDMLMNKGQKTAALRNAAYAGTSFTALYKARIALENRKKKGALELYKKVPNSLKKDMGLQYSLALHYFNKRDNINALRALETIASKKQIVVYNSKYWRLKFRIVHRLLDKKHDRSIKLRAYKLLAGHHQPATTVQYVDAEFKAGWIAYVHFSDYKLAKKHFDKSERIARNTQQRSRIYYWQAQLARKTGQQANYNTYLNKAAKYRYTFYGQLAGERIGKSQLTIADMPKINRNFLQTIHQNQHADFIKIYNYLNKPRQIKYHYIKLRKTAKNANNMASLVEFAKSQRNQANAVNTARQGMIKGWNLQIEAYPNVKFPPFRTYTGRPEKALSYALIRQESMFDQYATSHTGAKGYMQIIKPTGLYLSQKYKVAYKNAWLHSKPELNLALGNSYIYDLIKAHNGSYVMGLAAYNGGGTWVKRWLKANGDPRDGEISFVNWIEAMPKAETRHYVKKVIKNIQIFNIRFNGNKSRTNIINSLITGER
ncbi:MAG: lytic transglycosylase domain-containing protein [Rhizobiales bacterium]|nr:lytic transglycosylase domain-containing protein [Hyphomicrobiales bacterium]